MYFSYCPTINYCNALPFFPALATAEEFSYDLSYKDKDAKENLQNSVAMKLIRQHRDTTSGLVVLVFNVIYNPFRTME